MRRKGITTPIQPAKLDPPVKSRPQEKGKPAEEKTSPESGRREEKD